MFNNINFNKPWKKVVPIAKGWSMDKKYYIIANDNQEYLLRVSNISLFEKRKKQYQFLKTMDELNINASKPLLLGKLNDNEIYTLLTWIKGEDAQLVIPKLEKEKQYVLGIKAGDILYKIHQLPINDEKPNWWELYQKKVDKKIDLINNCPINLPYKDMIINYVLENMHLVKSRQCKFQHGDYHVGNMIVNHGQIGIIDFDKVSIADPYDDFKSFTWNVYASPTFATGLIDGYFNFDIPCDFFPILALYAAEAVLGHLPWAIKFGDEEIKIALDVARSIIEWFNGFKNVVPSWYHI